MSPGCPVGVGVALCGALTIGDWGGDGFLPPLSGSCCFEGKSLARVRDAGQGTHQRRLARAVGTDQSHHLARVDAKVDAVQHFDGAVTG